MLEALFARNTGCLDLSIVCFSAMETVISIEYNELIRDGEFEMKTQIQDFLDSKVDEWKFSVTTHLWSDHYFRLLRRHFSLQLLVENPGEEPVWVPLPYDSTIAECLNLAQCRTRLTSYRIRVRLNPDRTVGNCGNPWVGLERSSVVVPKTAWNWWKVFERQSAEKEVISVKYELDLKSSEVILNCANFEFRV